MMKKWIFAFGIGTFLYSAANAQAPAEKALLWRISGPGIMKPSYLFGTMHLLCPADLKMTAGLEKAFTNTLQVFLELDMDDPALTASLAKSMLMKNDTSLQQLLSKSSYDSVSASFQKLTGTPLGLFSKVKPMLAMALIYPALLKCNPQGWETVFVKMAKDQHKEIWGLENIADQVAVFEKIPYKLQAEMLAESLLKTDSTKNSFEKLLTLYREKDLPALSAMMQEDKSMEAYGDIMLDDRNKNWVPVISKQVKTQPTFFAVGAAHLAGNNGVISLLRKQGYILQPIFDK
ncbi:MAG: lipoprotein [Chitinophagaceae bacterium]|nr:lipoprotein [Chitinophagaceae bacterium]